MAYIQTLAPERNKPKEGDLDHLYTEHTRYHTRNMNRFEVTICMVASRVRGCEEKMMDAGVLRPEFASEVVEKGTTNQGLTNTMRGAKV
mmetsp:Transcript_14177/g.43455  ORF Transcript_14177/g.43455 Transcript_14177/m.43455 type:complete len:89 (-) Transcript_14177:57-323(-)|eukprot:scaffold197174_cov48-Tisochrysis_lutea.AAC.1